MIKGFRDDSTRKVFARVPIRKWPPDLQRRALRKLLILDGAESFADQHVPASNRLDKLSGNRAGEYSVRINDKWRICFRWHSGDAHAVEITDCH